MLGKVRVVLQIVTCRWGVKESLGEEKLLTRVRVRRPPKERSKGLDPEHSEVTEMTCKRSGRKVPQGNKLVPRND